MVFSVESILNLSLPDRNGGAHPEVLTEIRWIDAVPSFEDPVFNELRQSAELGSAAFKVALERVVSFPVQHKKMMTTLHSQQLASSLGIDDGVIRSFLSTWDSTRGSALKKFVGEINQGSWRETTSYRGFAVASMCRENAGRVQFLCVLFKNSWDKAGLSLRLMDESRPPAIIHTVNVKGDVILTLHKYDTQKGRCKHWTELHLEENELQCIEATLRKSMENKAKKALTTSGPIREIKARSAHRALRINTTSRPNQNRGPKDVYKVTYSTRFSVPDDVTIVQVTGGIVDESGDFVCGRELMKGQQRLRWGDAFVIQDVGKPEGCATFTLLQSSKNSTQILRLDNWHFEAVYREVYKCFFAPFFQGNHDITTSSWLRSSDKAPNDVEGSDNSDDDDPDEDDDYDGMDGSSNPNGDGAENWTSMNTFEARFGTDPTATLCGFYAVIYGLLCHSFVDKKAERWRAGLLEETRSPQMIFRERMAVARGEERDTSAALIFRLAMKMLEQALRHSENDEEKSQDFIKALEGQLAATVETLPHPAMEILSRAGPLKSLDSFISTTSTGRMEMTLTNLSENLTLTGLHEAAKRSFKAFKTLMSAGKATYSAAYSDFIDSEKLYQDVRYLNVETLRIILSTVDVGLIHILSTSNRKDRAVLLMQQLEAAQEATFMIISQSPAPHFDTICHGSRSKVLTMFDRTDVQTLAFDWYFGSDFNQRARCLSYSGSLSLERAVAIAAKIPSVILENGLLEWRSPVVETDLGIEGTLVSMGNWKQQPTAAYPPGWKVELRDLRRSAKIAKYCCGNLEPKCNRCSITLEVQSGGVSDVKICRGRDGTGDVGSPMRILGNTRDSNLCFLFMRKRHMSGKHSSAFFPLWLKKCLETNRTDFQLEEIGRKKMVQEWAIIFDHLKNADALDLLKGFVLGSKKRVRSSPPRGSRKKRRTHD